MPIQLTVDKKPQRNPTEAPSTLKLKSKAKNAGPEPRVTRSKVQKGEKKKVIRPKAVTTSQTKQKIKRSANHSSDEEEFKQSQKREYKKKRKLKVKPEPKILEASSVSSGVDNVINTPPPPKMQDHLLQPTVLSNMPEPKPVETYYPNSFVSPNLTIASPTMPRPEIATLHVPAATNMDLFYYMKELYARNQYQMEINNLLYFFLNRNK